MDNAKTFEEYKEISKNIQKLIKDGKYKEALELCTEERCQNDIAIQGQKIMILFKIGRPEEIKEECDKAYKRWNAKQFIKSKLIAISQRIKELMAEEKYKEALKLCTEERCQNDIAIQGQKIMILFKIGRPEEIIEECDKAYKRWNVQKFIKSKLIAISQRIKELMIEEKYKEALELCTQDICQNNIVIQDQKEKILRKLSFRQNIMDVEKQWQVEKDNFRSLLLTRIYYGDIEFEEINTFDMPLWDKLILCIAWCEKENKKRGLLLLKQTLPQMELTQEQMKVINKLKERLSTKKTKVMDYVFYCDVLDCSILSSYVPKKEENKELEENDNVYEEKQSVPSTSKPKKQDKKSSKIIVIEGENRNRYSNAKNDLKPKNVQGEKKQEIYIKDAFANELFEIKKYIYVDMNWGKNQKGAISVWDTLECLEEKLVTDEFAYKKMLRIISVCNRAQILKSNEKLARKRIQKN